MKHQHVEATQRRPRRIQRLSDLHLTEKEFRALRRQGSVCGERRRGGMVFKLRFRTKDGRQHVRYIGNDSDVAAVIRRELQGLQRHRHHVVNLKRQRAKARKLMRKVKEDSRHALAKLGFHYHGFAIRKCSSCTQEGAVDGEAVD